MAEFKTRCPKCATAFRISEQLLDSAKGMVRCGSCLNIFNAKTYLEPLTQEQENPSKTKRANAPAPPPADPSNVRTRLKTGGVSSSAQLAQPQTKARPPEHKEPSNLFERETPAEKPQPADDNQTNDVDDDEAWALELLKDDGEPSITLKKIVEVKKEPELEKPEDKEDPTDIDAIEQAKVTPKSDIKKDESFLEEALPPLETSEASAEPVNDSPEQTSDTPDSDSAEGKYTQADAEASPGELSEARQKAIEKYTSGSTEEPPKLQDVIASLEPEPLEVAWQGEKTSWQRRLMWPALAVVALTALLIQIAWLEFNRLNRVEPYRSMYGIACSVIGCELPEMIDRGLIKTSNLLVRSHPKVSNALLVDVILQNNANFEQTFPNLILTFTDIKNKPVAERKLTPDEYLGGELKGRSTMPIKHPIHISLEIVDPGSNAVSYSIAIVD